MKNDKISFNITHPELIEGERFLTNISIPNVIKYKNDDRYRIGNTAYTTKGVKIEGKPIFKIMKENITSLPIECDNEYYNAVSGKDMCELSSNVRNVITSTSFDLIPYGGIEQFGNGDKSLYVQILVNKHMKNNIKMDIELAKEMRQIANEYEGDGEAIHSEQDKLLCKTLLKLGYTETVKVYEESDKY